MCLEAPSNGLIPRWKPLEVLSVRLLDPRDTEKFMCKFLPQKISKSHLKSERHGDQYIMYDRSLCSLFTFSSGIRAFFQRKDSKSKKIYRLFSKGISLQWKHTLPLMLLRTSWLTSPSYQRITGKVTCWVGRMYGTAPQPTSSIKPWSDNAWPLSWKDRSTAGFCCLQ